MTNLFAIKDDDMPELEGEESAGKSKIQEVS